MNATPPRPPIKPRSDGQGRKLCELRLRAGLRQSDLAILLGRINPGRISEWEQGQKPIPVDRWTQIQDLLCDH